jgi:mono/diheme cytochrome c family protein
MKALSLTAFGLVVAAMLLAACGGGSNQPTLSSEAQKFASLKGDAAAGKTKFASTCAACHGPDAKGLPGLGKDLTTSTFAKGLPDAELILFITKGRAPSDPLNTTGVQMPPRGGNPAFTDQDLADIVAYVRTMEK